MLNPNPLFVFYPKTNKGFETNNEEWENGDLPSYFESMQAWIKSANESLLDIETSGSS